ncbi:cyclin-like protein [Pelagophyceae sp. CCMP2097]|nr:cyclin-like protein [Pelagophyceae sp. CCMP2097]
MIRLQRLSSTEGLYEPRPDYIHEVQRDGMNESWRGKIITWFHQLGESFKMSGETLSVATNYLDRYLSLKSVGSVNFQLASIASIFLASKVEEPRPFRTADFVALSDGIFSASDLRLMELELLCTLKWHLHPPTVTEFIHLLLLLFYRDFDADEAKAILEHAGRYAEIARMDSVFLKYPASMIAVAAIICALKHVGAAMPAVARWMHRVQGCRLAYTERPDAAQAISECGLKLIAADSSECSILADAEVERMTCNASSTASESAVDDDEREVEDPKSSKRSQSRSPNDVMDIEAIVYGSDHTHGGDPPKFKRPAESLLDAPAPIC